MRIAGAAHHEVDARIIVKIPVWLLAIGISFSAFGRRTAAWWIPLPAPFAQIHTVGMDEAHWTRGFWADRFELCRTQMVPSMASLMEGTNYSQFFRNFEITAGTGGRKIARRDVQRRRFLQIPRRRQRDAGRDKRRRRWKSDLDEIIAVIAKAQRNERLH